MRKIKKGDRFLCKETVVMHSGATAYVRGKTYLSEQNGCITSDLENPSHVWGNVDDDDTLQYFQLIEEDYKFKVGDRVVLGTFDDSIGIRCNDEMHKVAGNIGIITSKQGDGFWWVNVGGDMEWNYPEGALALVDEIVEESPFMRVATGLANLLEYKNEQYGNSALNPINVFAGKSKVGHRADDKLSRIKNSPELRKNDVSDLMGYLMLICVENGWDNFDEFKD